MELIGALVYYCFSLTNIFLLLYILKNIFTQAKIYPFNKTDPYSELLFIMCIFFHQLSYFIYAYYIYYDNIPLQNLSRIFAGFFDHFLCFFPLIYKIKSVTKLFKYSYQHLSFFYSDEFQQEKTKDKEKNKINNLDNNTDKKGKIYEEFYKNRAENPNKDLNMSFVLLFFMVSILIIIISLIYYFPQLKCFLFYSIFGRHSLINQMECLNIDQYTNNLYVIIISKNIIYYSFLVYIIIILFDLWKYEINCDIFYIRLELTINFLWIILHHFIFHSYLLFFKNQTPFDTLIYNFLIDFSLTLLHLFFIRVKEKQKIKRKKKQEDLLNYENLLDGNQSRIPQYIIMLSDFNKFMKNIFCYLSLKKYIKSNPEYDYVKNYLDFYIDYYLYKIHIKKDELVKKTDLIIHAYFIYNKYFKKDDYNINLLDVPSEIIEDIEDKSRDEFCLTRKQLHSVYDKAFKIIYDKLYQVYAQLMEDRNAITELKKILEYTELDEIKPEIIEL